MAGARARGATLYVTLEPCAHHGRTPPCAPAVIAAGVYAVSWRPWAIPNPLVAGRGFAMLRGGRHRGRGRARCGGSGAAEPGVPHRHARGTAARHAEGRGMTLDGKIADLHGASRWITGEVARAASASAAQRSPTPSWSASGPSSRDDPRLDRSPGASRGRGSPFASCSTRPRVPRPQARILAAGIPASTVIAVGGGGARPSASSACAQRAHPARVSRRAMAVSIRAPPDRAVRARGARGPRRGRRRGPWGLSRGRPGRSCGRLRWRPLLLGGARGAGRRWAMASSSRARLASMRSP